MDLDQFCQDIVVSPSIRGRVVVLCEGDRSNNDKPTPSSYRKMEKLQDAAFYKACIPHNWPSAQRPIFINAGSRAEVLDTYKNLLAIHQGNLEASYLQPDRLFAIVDIDLQSQNLADDDFSYHFSDIDEAFRNLYSGLRVNEINASKHRIWFTGLIHKEAYFLDPQLQHFFDDVVSQHNTFSGKCYFADRVLNLDEIYQTIAQETTTDQDLSFHWHRAAARIQRHCDTLDVAQPKAFQESWLEHWQQHKDNQNIREKLAYTLLAVRKAKPYWQQIHMGENSQANKKICREFREDLSLQLASEVYAKQEGRPDQHLACFFKHLYQVVHSR